MPILPKSLGVSDDPVDEVILPDAIDDRPPGERVARVGDPSGQRRTARRPRRRPAGSSKRDGSPGMQATVPGPTPCFRVLLAAAGKHVDGPGLAVGRGERAERDELGRGGEDQAAGGQAGEAGASVCRLARNFRQLATARARPMLWSSRDWRCSESRADSANRSVPFRRPRGRCRPPGSSRRQRGGDSMRVQRRDGPVQGGVDAVRRQHDHLRHRQHEIALARGEPRGGQPDVAGGLTAGGKGLRPGTRGWARRRRYGRRAR